jgi:hypothetical protein
VSHQFAVRMPFRECEIVSRVTRTRGLVFLVTGYRVDLELG